MERSADDRPPPPYLGDFPHGAYWSAHGPDGSVDDGAGMEDVVDGTTLRIMWDEGAGPLWGEEGLLPDDPEWLRRALGLSGSLIADLRRWVRDMDAARERGQSQTRLHRRGWELTERLSAEVGSRFRVEFHP